MEQGYELTLDPTRPIISLSILAALFRARKKSLSTIFEMAQIKTQTSRKLVVTGCLAQRYGDELLQEMPEIDVLVGTGDFQHLPQILV
jgi:ribosomal protein S12 methylthiotransferase